MQRPGKLARAPLDSALKTGSHPINTGGALGGVLRLSFAIGAFNRSPL
jgi:hypothetical protein